MFLLGLTAAGRIIVGLTYTLELNLVKFHEQIIFYLLLAETGGIIGLTAWYQFVDRSWFWIQFLCLILAIITFLYFWIFVPESSKWLYTWQQYDNSKKSLSYIAKANGNKEKRLNHINNLVFDAETVGKDDSIVITEKNS